MRKMIVVELSSSTQSDYHVGKLLVPWLPIGDMNTTLPGSLHSPLDRQQKWNSTHKTMVIPLAQNRCLSHSMIRFDWFSARLAATYHCLHIKETMMMIGASTPAESNLRHTLPTECTQSFVYRKKCLAPLLLARRMASRCCAKFPSKMFLVTFFYKTLTVPARIAEGSLEVKLPTMWTDEKAEVGRVSEEKKREDQRRERVRRKKMLVREKVGKSRITTFF